MPPPVGPRNNLVTDSAFDEELQTLLASWPLPARQLSGMAVFMRSMMIAQLEDLATSGNGRKPSLPMKMLADALKGLQAGQDHPIFQPARTRHGSRGRGRPLDEQDARKIAAVRFSVRYLLSSEQETIQDGNPKQTICEAFCVDRTTVGRWFTKYRNDVKPLSTIPEELAKQLLTLAGAVYANTLKKLSD